MRGSISYGKANVACYRTYAAPLRAATIAQSPFVGRANNLFAVDIDVEVFGENFWASYTEGDNSAIVATDTMKNFVLRQALQFEGATLEGLLLYIGQSFLHSYDQIESLRIAGRELRFAAAPVASANGFTPSDRLFSRSHDDHASAELTLRREGTAVVVAGHDCGRSGLQLIKLTGSSFASFMRDEHTTLPERIDRALFIFLDVGWRYVDPDDMLAPESPHYLDAEQVRDFVAGVFHDFNSNSIQHLVHEMGSRLLSSFSQLAEVRFDAQNRLWDTAFVAPDDERRKVYCDPRPPYGMIRLTLAR